MREFVFTACAVVLVSGCASLSPRQVAEPSELTVSAALEDIGNGFNNLSVITDEQLGLYPCKVIVTLNVTASANDSSKLVLDVNATAPATVVDASGKLNAEASASSSGTRGNNVTIEMYNPVCLPKGTLGHEKPQNLKDLVDPLRALIGEAPYNLNN